MLLLNLLLCFDFPLPHCTIWLIQWLSRGQCTFSSSTFVNNLLINLLFCILFTCRSTEPCFCLGFRWSLLLLRFLTPCFNWTCRFDYCNMFLDNLSTSLFLIFCLTSCLTIGICYSRRAHSICFLFFWCLFSITAKHYFVNILVSLRPITCIAITLYFIIWCLASYCFLLIVSFTVGSDTRLIYILVNVH